MKKILVPALLLFSLCMVGCSKNEEFKKETETPKETTYKCTYSGEEYNNGTIEATLDGEKVTKVTQTMSKTFDDETELNDAYDMYQFAMAMINSQEGVTGKITKNGKTLTISQEMVIGEMTSDDLNDMFETENVTKDAFKTIAEYQEFTCK